MERSLSCHDALTRHPVHTQNVLDELNQKLVKAKAQTVCAPDVDWAYIWAVALGKGSSLDNCHVSLSGRVGRRQSLAALSPHGGPMARADLPPEVFAVHDTSTIKTLDPATYPHVAAFSLVDTKGKRPALATSGYRSKRGTFIHHVCPGNALNANGKAFEILLRINGRDAVWWGSLIPSAQARFETTPPGGVFRYRNAPLTRLIDAEIHALVANKMFTLSF